MLFFQIFIALYTNSTNPPIVNEAIAIAMKSNSFHIRSITPPRPIIAHKKTIKRARPHSWWVGWDLDFTLLNLTLTCSILCGVCSRVGVSISSSEIEYLSSLCSDSLRTKKSDFFSCDSLFSKISSHFSSSLISSLRDLEVSFIRVSSSLLFTFLLQKLQAPTAKAIPLTPAKI